MIKYEVIIYRSDEDDAFIAEVPELPGCAAHGATQDGAFGNAQDASGSILRKNLAIRSRSQKGAGGYWPDGLGCLLSPSLARTVGPWRGTRPERHFDGLATIQPTADRAQRIDGRYNGCRLWKCS